MKRISKWFVALVLLPAAMAANAALTPVNSGALISDTTYNLMWVADGNLMATQAASYPGGAAAYVDAIIAASGGSVLNLIHPGAYNLTAGDFDTSTGAMSWYGALAWVNYLNATSYQGYQDWRLPEVLLDSMPSIGTPDGNSGNPPIASSELAELFYGQLGQVAGSNIQTTHNSNYALFNNLQSIYSFGSVYSSIPPRVWNFNTSIGDQRGWGLAAWQAMAVRSELATLTPGILNFSTQLVGAASAPQVVTIENTGPGSLPIDSVITDLTDYKQTNTCGSSLAPGTSCTFNVTFMPGAAGATPGALFISSGNTAFSVALVGVGTTPVTMSPSVTNVTVGVPVTLTWTGAADASCSASGGAAGDGWSGSLASTGTKPVTETASGSYTYSITCMVGTVTTRAQATVAMTVPTATVSATPTTSSVNGTITLTWSSTNADGCSASGGSSGDGWAGSKAASGTASVAASAAGTMTYTIACTSGPQSTSASTQVTVTAPHSGGGGALDLLSLMLLLGIVARQLARGNYEQRQGAEPV